MAFSGNGAWLALGSDGLVEIATGTTRRNPKGKSLLGPAAGNLFLRMEYELFTADAAGKEHALGYEPPFNAFGVASPSGRHALFYGISAPGHRGALLLELATLREQALPVKDCLTTAVAWSPDESLLAMALAFPCEQGGRIAEEIVVFDRAGKVARRWPSHGEHEVTALAFDLDGRSVVWSGRLLHRVDLATGRQLAWGEPPQLWWAPLDAHLALGHDDRRLILFGNHTLAPLRRFDLGCSEGTDGVRACALAPNRDVLAIETPKSLRIYRITP
jgi:hypothetical protein